MSSTRLALPIAATLALAPLTAQSPLPHLLVDPSPLLRPSNPLVMQIDGRPGTRYAILADVSSGPVQLLGEEIRLGFTPALAPFASGIVPSFGRTLLTFPLPTNVPALAGTPVYFQAVTIDPNQPSGTLQLSNGESTVPRTDVLAIVERFDVPGLEGFQGTYDPASRDALRGTVGRRTVRTTDPEFLPFNAPITGPLSEAGARVQNVFRPVDLEATGSPELLTAIRWRAYGGTLQAGQFDRVDLEIGHTTVTPDFSIDPFSALPRFPNSGLDTAYALNLNGARDRLMVRSGAYAVQPSDLRSDGYVDYQLARPYPYNGVDSLLLDFRTGANAQPSGFGVGQVLQITVTSSANPFARVATVGGTPSNPGTVDPDQVQTGRGDNGVMDYQFEFTRIESVAVSPFRAANLSSPDYQQPIAATVLRGQSLVRFEFRGADDAAGTNATAFSSNIDLADGKPFLQTRIVLIADPVTLEVPEVDTLVVPIR